MLLSTLLCGILFIFLLPGIFLLMDVFSLNFQILQEGWHLFVQSAVPTLLISLGSSLLASFLGFWAAFFLVKPALPFRLFFLALVISGLAIPLHIHASHWMILFGRSGYFTLFFQSLFPSFSLYSIAGVVWITGVSFSPLATLICVCSFIYSNNNALADQTRLYLTPTQRFFWVLFPQRLWGPGISFLLVFLFSLGEMAVVDLFGMETLGRQIYLFLSLYYKPEMAILMTVPRLLMTCLVCLVFSFLWKRKGNDFLETIQTLDKKTSFVARKKILLAFLLLLCKPYIVCLPAFFIATGSLQNLSNTFFSVAPELWHSFLLSLVSSFCILIFSLPLSWIILRKSSRLFLFSMLWVAILPSPLTAIGILRIFTRAGDIPLLGNIFLYLRDTDIILITGLLLRYVPYVLFLCLLAMSQLPIQLEEIASLFGCNPLRQFFYVVLPLSKKTISLAFFTAFLLCLLDLNLTLLLVPPGTTTLTIRIFTLLHYGVRSDVAGTSFFLILMVLVIVFAVYFILNRKRSGC